MIRWGLVAEWLNGGGKGRWWREGGKDVILHDLLTAVWGVPCMNEDKLIVEAMCEYLHHLLW